MGLDQYAYVAAYAGQQDEYYEKGSWDAGTQDFVSTIEKPRELAYWRKHPNLQGWMELLWLNKGGDPDMSFNGIELELTWDDLARLEKDILNNQLPKTEGFFFGDSADDYYRAQDLDFIKDARAELFLGLRVFYNSSW